MNIKSLHESLNIIKQGSLPYVCIEGHTQLLAPSSERERFVFLTSDTRSLTSMMGAVPAASASAASVRNNKNPFFEIPGVCELEIYNKGNGFFPERFESELLNNRVIFNDLVHIPPNDQYFWSMTYRRIVHQGELRGVDEQWRKLLLDQIKQRVGFIVKPMYKNLGWYQ